MQNIEPMFPREQFAPRREFLKKILPVGLVSSVALIVTSIAGLSVKNNCDKFKPKYNSRTKETIFIVMLLLGIALGIVSVYPKSVKYVKHVMY